MRPNCPACAAKKSTIPIVYGEVGPDEGDAAKRGELVIGGCIVWPERPRWACRACKHQFGLFKETP